MPPPYAGQYRLDQLLDFDDMALAELLPDVDAAMLGTAAHALPAASAFRLGECLHGTARDVFVAAHGDPAPDDLVSDAAAAVVDALFWPLLYWHEPLMYDELIAGERLHPAIVGHTGIGGKKVCDVGAGTGRFTRLAAHHARSVIAVDLIPALLDILRHRLAGDGSHNVELRRGGFRALPLDDRSVDVAVSCSAVSWGHGTDVDGILDELERVVKPGGRIVVVWPDRPDRLREHGFKYHEFAGNVTHGFRDVPTAIRMCRAFYGEDAADWVRRHRTAEVPYEVLGTRPPNDVCIRDLPA